MAAALRAFNRGVRLLFTVSLKVEDREQLADHKPLTKNIDHIKLKGTDLFKAVFRIRIHLNPDPDPVF